MMWRRWYLLKAGVCLGRAAHPTALMFSCCCKSDAQVDLECAVSTGSIFINYRRDDARDMAARVHDRVAQAFGQSNLFMDVDKLGAGQRFDLELEKALAQTDVLLAIIGPRWLDILLQRQQSAELDYVVDEIAGALSRGRIVIPVLIDQTQLPRADLLPPEIRGLVLHQAVTVGHERFGNDTKALIDAIRRIRSQGQSGPTRIVAIGAVSAILATIAMAAYYFATTPNARPAAASTPGPSATADRTLATQLAAPDPTPQQPARQAQPALADASMVASERGRTPGSTFRDCDDGCPDMVVIPAGTFQMGASDRAGAAPRHEVRFERQFALGKFEVTFAQWDACVRDGGCSVNRRPGDEGWGRGYRPIINVSWQDAQEYVIWLSRKAGKAYRLPSEAEWEYAARSGGDDPPAAEQAQVGTPMTRDVGSFRPNAFGLFDMWGNVWEMCADAFHPSHAGAPGDGTPRAGAGSAMRVLRGGSWFSTRDDLRATLRVGAPPDMRFKDIGFRVARAL